MRQAKGCPSIALPPRTAPPLDCLRELVPQLVQFLALALLILLLIILIALILAARAELIPVLVGAGAAAAEAFTAFLLLLRGLGSLSLAY